MSGRSVSHYQKRARGLCALCTRPVDDADERLHHGDCDWLYSRGWRVTEIRTMSDKAMRAIRDKYAVPGSRHLLLVSHEELIEVALGFVSPRVMAQAAELREALEAETLPRRKRSDHPLPVAAVREDSR